ncbi:MAG TPA: SDR family oxidoreductase [Tepidisphaeraceae bacterium]|nr:SDR family oxidoreductase [Tepidisphaeraceae bacterium]
MSFGTAEISVVNPKRVLVTGGSGMLGATLVPTLIDEGHSVVRHAHAGQGDVRGDLAEWKSARKVFDSVNPDVIVNLAAKTDVAECEADPKAAYLVNVRLVENLVRWTLGNSCHLIQVSTDHVYGGNGPHREDQALPVNYYAFSKYAGELAAMVSANATVIRTNFFGPSRSSARISFSDWLVNAMEAGERIVVYEDVMFSPLTMVRLAQYIEMVVLNPRRGIFNVGSRAGKSKADFAFRLGKVMKLQTNTMQRGSYQATPGIPRPRDMRMDCDLFESSYGLTLPTLDQEIDSLGTP